MEPTIKVTEPALSKLQEVLAGKDVPGIRVKEASGGSCEGASFSLAADDPTAADEVVDLEGVRVFVGKILLQRHGGFTVDYARTPAGEGFVINPVKLPGHHCGACQRSTTP